MTGTKIVPWLFAIWTIAVIFIGGVLASYHQPFQAPSNRILALVKQTPTHEWKAIHILSGSCGCSQKVMLHLLERRPISGIDEQVVVIDGDEPNLPDTAALLARLTQEGFPVTHIPVKETL